MAQFGELVDEILDFIWETNPVGASFAGIHKYDGELGRFGRDYLEEVNSKTKDYLVRVQSIPEGSLDSQEKIDRALVTNSLSSSIKEFEEIRGWEKDPATYTLVGIYGIFILAIREFAPLEDRVRSLLSRLSQVPRVLEEGRANLRDSPEVFTKVAIEETKGGIRFLEGLIPKLAEKVAGLKEELLAANGDALAAVRCYLEFLKEEWLPASKGDFAIGKDLFDFKLRTDHILPYTSDELFKIGEEVLTKTESELEVLAREIDPERDWLEILDGLKREHPQPDSLIEVYKGEMEKARQFTMEKELVTIPEGEELEVIPTPVFKRSTIPYAAYMPPAPFEEEQKGLFYVTPVNEELTPEEQEEQLRGHSVYKIPITALHEGYPGHHLQLVHSNRVSSKVRRMFSTSVFAEGWALYCEELMHDLGYYADPRMRLMQLRDQLWRAARVIIDVSLHTRGMTFDEAVDFLVGKAKLEKVNAIAEVKRYCATPTQPMSYVIGKLQIMKVREEYEKKRGKSFELRGFHDKLLSFGTIPVALLREEMLG